MITQKTAYDLWCAYSEIEKGRKLATDIQEAIVAHKDPNPRDAFGRQRCFQLGVPTSETGHRLLDVQPRLALAVINAHIAEKTALLEVLNEQALQEAKA